MRTDGTGTAGRGKKRRTALCGLMLVSSVALAFSAPARAGETLIDALVLAYRHNPTLQNERAQLRATDEQLSEALAGMRPQAQISSGVTRQWQTLTPGTVPSQTDRTNALNSASMGIAVSQPLYQGGQIQARIRAAENQIQTQRAVVLSTEQTVLLSAISAYMDIVRDQAILKLYTNYQKVLQERFEIEKRRLRVGENTKTDVSQAESRLAQAISDRIQVENNLHSSIADYVRVVGVEPGKLETPRITVELPATYEEVVEAAREANPDVISYQFAERAARDSVDIIDGQLLPTLNAVGNFTRSLQSGPTGIKDDAATVGFQLRLPLDNGSVAARARGARQTVAQRMFQVEEQQKRAVNLAVRDWNSLMAARAAIRAREAQVHSVNVTLGSLRNEVDIGARTLTDLLNAEQEALSARTAMVQARRNEVVLSLSLLADVGRLTAQNLKLPVDYYDYETHYQLARNKVWGVSLKGDPK
jgi:outer membrane protein/adhesin transport system outer membrane protein